MIPPQSVVKVVVACGVLLLTACQAPAPVVRRLPEGSGLVEEDLEPPRGVDLIRAPKWSVGDRFVYQRGDMVETGFVVEQIDDQGIWVGELNGVYRQWWGPGFTLQESVSAEGQTIRNVPGDARFSWPLWIGKRWSSRFVRDGGGRRVVVEARYEVEAREFLQIGDKGFDCLRIVRRYRTFDERSSESSPELTGLYWYSPSIGWLVRKIEAGVMEEWAGGVQSALRR